MKIKQRLFDARLVWEHSLKILVSLEWKTGPSTSTALNYNIQCLMMFNWLTIICDLSLI